MDAVSAGTTPAYYLGGGGPTSFDEHGRESPIATSRTPRPGKGHDDETTRRTTTTRWCL